MKVVVRNPENKNNRNCSRNKITYLLHDHDLLQLKESKEAIFRKIPRNLTGGELCNSMLCARNIPPCWLAFTAPKVLCRFLRVKSSIVLPNCQCSELQ